MPAAAVAMSVLFNMDVVLGCRTGSRFEVALVVSSPVPVDRFGDRLASL
jgi:hypothetical protein